ncbi:MAG: penicillin acylase family protein [Anaerolineales bacterium]|nr:penicillin acylase family protein [Anaerolineales bacterium]
MRLLQGVLRTLLIAVLALALVAGLLIGATVTRSFPQTRGTVRLPGLRGSAEVLRDANGIPHLYADTAEDLFMAQGYVHAQDRFYQMDFWRHITAGRLSELFGAGRLNTDKFLRTSGWRRVAEQEYASAEPATRAILDAYAAGVNAYLANRSGPDLSLEYSILALNGLTGYTPDPWTGVDSIAWGKAMAWDLSGNLDAEIMRAVLNQTIGVEKTNAYMPLYPHGDHPVIVPTPAFDAAGLGALRGLSAQLAELGAVTGGAFEGIGSNDWVIGGGRTASGMPLLADDPHLGIRIPSIWYQNSLHCRTLTAECPYDVTGYSFAGVPAVIIGHNTRIAWGVTNVGPDVQDLFIEKVNPADPNQYEVNGQWVNMEVRQETIQVLGGGREEVTIRSTRHGPLITDVYGSLDEFAAGAGLDPANQYAFALKWTALQPGTLFQSVFKINRARNWDDFRIALRDWDVPSQNFVYADVDGNIGYQMPGNVPIRRGGDGLLPVPGWTDDYEWTGYIPFDQLPASFNPPQGYIATANNAVVGPEYPYLIALDWDPGYRAERIVSLIEAEAKHTPETIARIHGDNQNLGAGEVLPYLLALGFGEPELAQAQAELRAWDGQMDMASRPAAIYAAFFRQLLAATFHDDLPEAYWPGGGGDSWLTIRALLPDFHNAWWDDQTTPAVETRDEILRRAFAAGYAELRDTLGPDPRTWQWGRLHGSTFDNESLGRSGVSFIEAIFNRGPFPTSGGTSIVNATGFNVTNAEPYATRSVPSMRMIVDLSNLENTRMIHTTGQSGHAYAAHYIDMADKWRFIQYNLMPFGRAAVEAAAADRLLLVP